MHRPRVSCQIALLESEHDIGELDQIPLGQLGSVFESRPIAERAVRAAQIAENQLSIPPLDLSMVL